MTSPEEIDETILIKRYQEGETSVFETIVTIYWDRLFARALFLSGNREDAEEITQDTFIRAQKGLFQFRGTSSLFTWLFQIVNNLACNHYRKRKKHSELVPLEQPSNTAETGVFSFLETLEGKEKNPAEQIIDAEYIETLTKAIESLDPEDKELLLLRSGQNLPYTEIAERLKISIGATKSRINRARIRLRQILQCKNAQDGT